VIFRPPELPVVRTPGSPAGLPDPIPWREPEADMRRFFPSANAHREDVRILSGERLTLIRRLGRQPTGEEHLAVLHRVLRGDRRVGTVMVRRVPGTGGSIEVVLAVAPDGRVRGVRLQRQREPGPVAAALQSPEWLSAFVGKTAGSGWSKGQGTPSVPERAREPAGEILQAVRSALIVLEVAEARSIPAAPEAHH
jgi:hypothetical protein